MHPTVVPQHHWLQKFIGEWTSEFEVPAEKGGAPMILKGKETVRSLGGIWIICESNSEMPEGGETRNVMTLGYDPVQSRFTGTFISGVMTHLWLYSGQLDAAKKVLTLDSEGPNFVGEGLAQYKDIITVIDDDHRMLTSETIGPDGTWQQFMSGHYYRVK